MHSLYRVVPPRAENAASKGDMVHSGQVYVPPIAAVYCFRCCHAAATPSNLTVDLKVVLRINDCLFGFVKVTFEVRFILVWPVRILLVPSIKDCLPGRFYQLWFPA